jgi:hypothetical protein
MRIFQLLSTIAYGDAVSNDTVAMEKAIKQMGYQTRIYAESIVPPLDKKTALAISELKDVSNDDIIIFHMSTGSRLNFDQAILYRTKGFIHLSLKKHGVNRKQILFK